MTWGLAWPGRKDTRTSRPSEGRRGLRVHSSGRGLGRRWRRDLGVLREVGSGDCRARQAQGQVGPRVRGRAPHHRPRGVRLAGAPRPLLGHPYLPPRGLGQELNASPHLPALHLAAAHLRPASPQALAPRPTPAHGGTTSFAPPNFSFIGFPQSSSGGQITWEEVQPGLCPSGSTPPAPVLNFITAHLKPGWRGDSAQMRTLRPAEGPWLVLGNPRRRRLSWD